MRNDSSSPTCDSISLRLIRLVTVAALTVSLAGCAAMKIGYNNADTLALFQLDSYLGLDAEIRNRRSRNASMGCSAGIASTQLRDYVAFIDKIRAKLGGPVTAADVMEFNQQLNARMMTAGDKAAPDIAHVALNTDARTDRSRRQENHQRCCQGAA